METHQTGYMYSEEFNWHNPCAGSLVFPAAEYPWIAVDEYYDDVNRIRQSYNLIARSGLESRLTPIAPRHASDEEMMYSHTPEYIEKLKALSEGMGGKAGPMAYVGHGSYDVMTLAVGGDLNAVDAVMKGEVKNAFCLQRPPGGHATKDSGFGFCIVNNFNIMAEYARKTYGLKRILIVDWDCHYKLGIHQHWYDSPDVLYAEVHQSGVARPDSPHDMAADNVGEGPGKGFNVSIPMPSGAGDKAYIKAFKEIIVPIADQYRPELIFIVAGFASNIFDPLGRQQLTAAGYGELIRLVMDIAERHCGGKIIAVMEGGKGPYMPFCVLRVVEQLSGYQTGVEDVITDEILDPEHGNDVTVDQEQHIQKAKRIQSQFWNL